MKGFTHTLFALPPLLCIGWLGSVLRILNKRQYLVSVILIFWACLAYGAAQGNEPTPGKGKEPPLGGSAVSHDVGGILSVDNSRIGVGLIEGADPSAKMPLEVGPRHGVVSSHGKPVSDESGDEASGEKSTYGGNSLWVHFLIGVVGGVMFVLLVIPFCVEMVKHCLWSRKYGRMFLPNVTSETPGRKRSSTETLLEFLCALPRLSPLAASNSIFLRPEPGCLVSSLLILSHRVEADALRIACVWNSS